MIAVDGKTVRGARTRTGDDDGRQPHLVAALDQHTGAVLAQTAVEQKSSEIAALPVVLDGLDITDAVITADALHVQRSHADYLHQRGAHYLLPVKATRPPCYVGCAPCPGPRSASTPGNAAAATTGSKPAPSRWSP